jgi:poly-gamma-glutamate capsule biosynthesis protein CapA/YwtB (metallophosphatase superfamily)
MQPYEKKILIGGIPFRIVVIGVFEILRNYDRVFNFYAKDLKGGTYGLDPRRLAAQIRSIKKEDPDVYVILFPHWGRNYSWKTDF